ncbi:hypothetical protein [Nostoc sp.]|uniref:hypothetical protein n=1 Tax=Nostoc sp. TaxID=1180 RepID=UPI002FF5785D
MTSLLSFPAPSDRLPKQRVVLKYHDQPSGHQQGRSRLLAFEVLAAVCGRRMNCCIPY